MGKPAVTWPRAAEEGWTLAGVNDRVELAGAEDAIQADILETPHAGRRDHRATR